MFRIKLAKQFDSPIEQAVRIVDAELKPVEAIGIPGKRSWRLDVIPGLVTVAMPFLRRFIERAVTKLEPLPQFSLAAFAIAIHAMRISPERCALVPYVVAEQRGMIAEMLHQRHQEGLGKSLHVRIVEAQSRKAASCTALRYGAVYNEPVASEVPGVGILAECPFRSTTYQFFENHF